MGTTNAEVGACDEINRPAGTRMTLTVAGVECAFRWIPPGSFLMGSPLSEQLEATAQDDLEMILEEYGPDYNAYEDEVQHKVNISRGFWMMETLITQEMWEAATGSNPSPSMYGTSKRLPVLCVLWDDCQEFVAKLNAAGICPDGFQFSLPTEAEWEYACRAGTTTAYWFGDALDGVMANCDGNEPFGTEKAGPRLNRPSEVGSYPPNPWGLFDMHGNVLEWTLDWEWHIDWNGPYPTEEVTDPKGAEFGSGRVVRGGGWDDPAVFCRSACRRSLKPDDPYVDWAVGARLVLTRR